MANVVVEMIKENISAFVEEPGVVVSFEVAKDTHIRVSITEKGELYLNASWGTLFIRPDHGNTCYISALPLGTHLESRQENIRENDDSD